MFIILPVLVSKDLCIWILVKTKNILFFEVLHKTDGKTVMQVSFIVHNLKTQLLKLIIKHKVPTKICTKQKSSLQLI